MFDIIVDDIVTVARLNGRSGSFILYMEFKSGCSTFGCTNLVCLILDFFQHWSIEFFFIFRNIKIGAKIFSKKRVV